MNLEKFLKKTDYGDISYKEIKWRSERIPNFLKKATNIHELKNIVKKNLHVISSFLSSYKSIEEKK